MNKELLKICEKLEALLTTELYCLSVEEIKIVLDHLSHKIRLIGDSLHSDGTDYDDNEQRNTISTEKLTPSLDPLDRSYADQNYIFYIDENNGTTLKEENSSGSGENDVHVQIRSQDEESDCDMTEVLFSKINDKATKTNELVSEDRSSPFQCGKCGKIYNSLNGYRYHCSVAHSQPAAAELAENLFWLRCPEEGCSYTTQNRTLLRVHANSHVNNAPFTCPVCKKDYLGGPKAMKQHIKLHADQRDFECPECGKSFISTSRLNYHILNVHSEPNFHCDQCSKMFRSKVNFNRHMRIHTDEKPFVCPYCAFNSNNSTNLTSHVRSVHKDANFTTGREQKSRKKAKLIKNILDKKTSTAITSLLNMNSQEQATDVAENLGNNLLKQLSEKGELKGNFDVDVGTRRHVGDGNTMTRPEPCRRRRRSNKTSVLHLKSDKCDKIITVRNSNGLLVNAVVKLDR